MTRAKAKLMGVIVAGVGSVTLTASAAFVSSTAAGDQQVTFKTTAGMGGVMDTQIAGTGSGVTATQAGDKITFRAPVAKLETRNSLRDKHLRGYLKEKDIVLVVDRAKLPTLADRQKKSGSVAATLSVAGTSKPTTVAYKAHRTGSDYHLEAWFTVNINDHGVETPCFAGVCVDPKVSVQVKRFKLHDR